MRTEKEKKVRRLSQSALPGMRARLALLNAAISALQRYQGYADGEVCGTVGEAVRTGVRSGPFLVPRRDDDRGEKAS
jgi:hypothetical protein